MCPNATCRARAHRVVCCNYRSASLWGFFGRVYSFERALAELLWKVKQGGTLEVCSATKASQSLCERSERTPFPLAVTGGRSAPPRCSSTAAALRRAHRDAATVPFDGAGGARGGRTAARAPRASRRATILDERRGPQAARMTEQRGASRPPPKGEYVGFGGQLHGCVIFWEPAVY